MMKKKMNIKLALIQKIKYIVLLHFLFCVNPVFSETGMLSMFTGTQPNVIQDSTHSLSAFFEKLTMLQNVTDTTNTVVRIVHIGDSHVRSHEFTPALHKSLTEIFGNAATGFTEGYKTGGILDENGFSGIICHSLGINGATSTNFSADKYAAEIQKLQPDLIIISLGTNESIGSYNAMQHYDMMENLFSILKNSCPQAAILYTTPPGAFKTTYRRVAGKKRTYRRVVSTEENKNIKNAASTIMQFAVDHNTACWDLFNVAGGKKYACKNWLAGKYFQRDKIHFTANGYALQGNLLYDALITDFNEYVLNRYE